MTRFATIAAAAVLAMTWPAMAATDLPACDNPAVLRPVIQTGIISRAYELPTSPVTENTRHCGADFTIGDRPMRAMYFFYRGCDPYWYHENWFDKSKRSSWQKPTVCIQPLNVGLHIGFIIEPKPLYEFGR